MVTIRRQTPPQRTTLLVIDDEVRSQRLLRVNLEPLGYRVVTLSTASDGTKLLEQHNPSLIVLDLKLSGTDGFELCRQVRAVSSVPIIIVSGSSQAADKVRGLHLGADDYITKPFESAELAARIGAVLRRVQGLPPSAPPILQCGELEIDFSQQQVTLAGYEVRLADTEYRLLECLAQNIGRTMVVDALLAKVWGPEYTGEYASVHLYISRLRRKLGETAQQPRYILTKPGIGYQMVAANQ